MTAGLPAMTDKSALKSSVESKLNADSEVAALKLDVDASKDGEVSLEGKAHSADQVGRAIALALGTDGVNKVTSKIKLDKDAKTTP
jgi:osmotically-inducible protein OsmY